MQSNLDNHRISHALQKALQTARLVTEDDSAVIFYDLDALRDRVMALQQNFPKTALHAIAVKANPLVNILKFFKPLNVGAEAATLPEVYLAEKSGYHPGRIVYDSPTKTVRELQYVLERGVQINADSLDELERIAQLVQNKPVSSSIGVRINPQVGVGKIAFTSVAGEYSKFGVPIKDERHALMECFLKYPWLRGVHLHIGSQTIGLEMLLRGVGTVVDFMQQVNRQLSDRGIDRRIEIFDLGGGLPVAYHPEDEPVTLEVYVAALRRNFPILFSNELCLITEFGRYVHANSAWVTSRVEYVKRASTAKTLMVHVGADLFLRKCYQPDFWHHEMFLCDSRGVIKTGATRKYTVAGPLCFAGDILARQIALPQAEPGDHLIIKDAGAYTLSTWSRHNSRQIPQVIGYEGSGPKFVQLKKRESLQEILKFWS